MKKLFTKAAAWFEHLQQFINRQIGVENQPEIHAD
jgi:hypothetical protein